MEKVLFFFRSTSIQEYNNSYLLAYHNYIIMFILFVQLQIFNPTIKKL